MGTYAKGKKFVTKITVPTTVDPKGRISRITDTEEAGRAWEAAVKLALKRGKALPEPDGEAKTVGGTDAGTLGNALRSAEVIRWGTARKKGKGQVLNARIFVKWVGANVPAREALTADTIQRYCQYLIKERRLTNQTISKHMSAIRIISQHANVPKLDLPKFKHNMQKFARARAFTVDEERKIVLFLDHVGQERYRDYFMFLVDTGLRPYEEGLVLDWKRNVRADRLVDVEGKSGMLRNVPLTKRAQLILSRCPVGGAGPWSDIKKDTFAHYFGDVIRPAIPELDGPTTALRCVWYTCRHTFATRMIRAGKNYGYIAKIMDNSVAMLEKVYGHPDEDDLAGAVAGLEQYGTPHLSLVQKQ